MKSNRVLTVLWILALSAATTALAGDVLTETFDRTYEVSSNCRISLENINGDVTVEVWDANEVRVVAERQASTQELLDKLRAFTNLRVVPDPDSTTDFALEPGPFEGWDTMPDGW